MVSERVSTKVDPSNLLRTHYAFQRGWFVSRCDKVPGGLRAFSEASPSPMWNHSAWIDGSSAEFESFIRSTLSWHGSLERPPAIYLTSTAAGEQRTLEQNGFQKFDEEAWLIAGNGPGKLSARVREGFDPPLLRDYSEVFSLAFLTQPPRLIQERSNSDGFTCRHFVLYLDQQSVAIGSLIYSGALACIYNIATRPSARNQGLGSELLQHLLASAAEAGCETVFLQAENGSAAHRLYEKLGFATRFVRFGYRRVVRPEAEEERTFLSTLFAHRPEQTLPAFAREHRPLPASLATALRTLSPPLEKSALCIAAWAYLLHRYSGRESATFGFVDQTDAEPVVRTLEIPSEETAIHWIQRLARVALPLPLEGRPETLLSLAPERPSTHGEKGSFPLEFHLRAEELEIIYRADLFAKETVRRVAGHYFTILESIAREPLCPVQELEILPEAERRQMLVTWNERSFVPVTGTVSKLFEEQVERTPEAVALILAAAGQSLSVEQLTYRQLNRRANRLAHVLQARGIGPEIAVAVLLDRSLEMIVSLLAIFKVGGIFVPLDPASPAERLNFILQEVNPRVVLTRPEQLDKLSAFNLPRGVVLFVNQEGERLPVDEKNLLSPVAPHHAAYILYTSGSTGTPKGVVVTHYALVNHSVDCRKVYGLSSRDRVLQFSAFHFDASLEQILPALVTGAALVVRGEKVWSPAEFNRCLQEHQLSVVDLPTAYWHELTGYWTAFPDLIPPHRLRLMIVGGEALSPDRLRNWESSPFRQTRLINAYGPTETIITSTSYELPLLRQVAPQSVNVPIGRPRADRKAYVLDLQRRPVPIGIPGELHLGGTLLARDYYKQPKLTVAAFIPDPFSDDPASRLYKTGDLVRYLDDGNLEFLGRVDDQVKVRGFRIELGEIEAVLRKHPAVGESLVLPRQEPGGQKHLLGYVVAHATRPRPAELLTFLRQTLPEYMIPHAIMVLDRWPLLANGKVDRRALPQPDAQAASAGGASVQGPRDPLELQVQLLFEQVLRRAPIGVTDSFFELGGDSLQALDLLIQIEKETGKQLPLATLYQASTTESIARELRAQVAPEQWSSLVPLQARGTRRPLYLLHTTPGDILAYGNLVHRLGPDQPCYGFQSLGLKDPHLSHTSIEEMARYYVDLLRRFQPHGPYFLGGWCYGGIVAVEMARVLKAQGTQVGLLALLETVAMPARLSNYRYYFHRFRCLLRMSPARWLRYCREKQKFHRNSKLADRKRFRQVDGTNRQENSRDPRLIQLEHVYNTNLAALDRYRSLYYDGVVTLFNAAVRDDALIPDRDYGWVGLAPRIEVNEVPGNHDTMLAEPNVSILAQALSERLSKAHSPGGLP